MPIEIAPAPTAGAQLYVNLARALTSLGLGERMQLLNAFQSGVPFRDLPPRLRGVFDSVAATVRTPPRPGEPW